MKLNTSKNKKLYTRKYSKDKANKIKREGIILNGKNGSKIIKIKASLPVLKNHKKPTITIQSHSDKARLISYSQNEESGTIFIDYKMVNSSMKWHNLLKLEKLTKNKIYTMTHNIAPGECLKYRITHIIENSIEHSDVIHTGDETFEKSRICHMSFKKTIESIEITIIGLEKYTGGTFKVFRKDNTEKKLCIIAGMVSSAIQKVIDKDVVNHELYRYSVEVYDLYGNMIESDEYFVDYILGIKIIDAKVVCDGGKIYVPYNSEDYFTMELYDFTTQTATITEYHKDDDVFNVTSDKVLEIDSLKDEKQSVNIEGYIDNTLVSTYTCGYTRKANKAQIENANIEINNQNDTVIKWNHVGDIDRFIVTKVSKAGNSIVGEVQHRESSLGYSYIIDGEFKYKRIPTTYIINAIDKFDKIILKQRIEI